MKLTIHARHLELAPAAEEQVRRRVRLALGRLAGAIEAVDVAITDVNGPRGGVDKACRVRLSGPRLGTVVATRAAAAPLAAVAGALERAARGVRRALARRRAFVPA